MRRDLGDFQTPVELVDAILRRLTQEERVWERLIEPTCGTGTFLRAIGSHLHSVRQVVAVEIQPSYVNESIRALDDLPDELHREIRCADVFSTRFDHIDWKTDGPLLVVGNPPWVTSAELSSLGSVNLPPKANTKRLRGIEAMTGASNFDLGEAIWLKLIRELHHNEPTIALLCKTSVARSVLSYLREHELPLKSASIYKIDSQRWFGASVDACLFVVDLRKGPTCYEAHIFKSLEDEVSQSVAGFAGDHFLWDLGRYEPWRGIDGICQLTWRQGVKHDAADVMELMRMERGTFVNGLGQPADIESDLIYPLHKSSTVYRGDTAPKWVIIPQRSLQDDLERLRIDAPLAWQYLSRYEAILSARKSSIYTRKHKFSIFGIGPYSFSTYKVAISGLHKMPKFRVIGPTEEKPTMLDDTSYFISCRDEAQASSLADLLNSDASREFLLSASYPDAKRPFTKKLLQRLDVAALARLAKELGLLSDERLEALGELTASSTAKSMSVLESSQDHIPVTQSRFAFYG